MCLRNAVAASSPEDVAGRNIPDITGALFCMNLTWIHSLPLYKKQWLKKKKLLYKMSLY